MNICLMNGHESQSNKMTNIAFHIPIYKLRATTLALQGQKI